MQKDKLFNDWLTYQDEHDEADLGMILSNNINIVIAGKPGIMAGFWDGLILDILRWHNRKLQKEKVFRHGNDRSRI